MPKAPHHTTVQGLGTDVQSRLFPDDDTHEVEKLTLVGSIDTLEIGKGYKAGLLSPPSKPAVKYLLAHHFSSSNVP